MRRTTVTVLVSAIVFGFLATWLGPKMIAYWYAPPVPSGANAAFNCTEAVTWAMGKLVMTQLIGTLAGAVIGLVLGILMRPKTVIPPPVTPPPAAGRAP